MCGCYCSLLEASLFLACVDATVVYLIARARSHERVACVGFQVLKLITLWTNGLFVLIFGGYAVAATLTTLSTNDFVCVGWDSAGVTTGTVARPGHCFNRAACPGWEAEMLAVDR